MKRFFELIADPLGNLAAGVRVEIRTLAGVKADLFADAEGVTLKSNPMTSAGDGSVTCYMADGEYLVVVSPASNDERTYQVQHFDLYLMRSEVDQVIGLAGDIDNVGAVADALGDIDTMLPHLGKINLVSQAVGQVVTVADKIEELGEVAANLGIILEAEQNAAAALEHKDAAAILAGDAQDAASVALTHRDLASEFSEDARGYSSAASDAASLAEAAAEFARLARLAAEAAQSAAETARNQAQAIVGDVSWNIVVDKPTAYPPEVHSHAQYAPLASPTFSGTVTAPNVYWVNGGSITATASGVTLTGVTGLTYVQDKANLYHRFYVNAAEKLSVRDTQIVAAVPIFCEVGPASGNHLVNKTYVDTKFSTLIGAAPAALDTIYEIAAELADQDSAVAALNGVIATKASLSGAEFVGPVSGIAPTSALHFTTKAYVDATALPQTGGDYTGGFEGPSASTALIGTTLNPEIADGHWRNYVNAGSFLLNAPVSNVSGFIDIIVTNATGAGALSTNGFAFVHGEFSPTVGVTHTLQIKVNGGYKTLVIVKDAA